MNNEITEDYCSYEVSKLLKEKGFNVPTDYLITKGNEIPYCSILKGGTPDNPEWYLKKQINSHYSNISNHLSCPTHALAIKWIRENFEIHISCEFTLGWGINILNLKDKTTLEKGTGYLSPKEAIEVALLHTLKNII